MEINFKLTFANFNIVKINPLAMTIFKSDPA